MTDEEIMKKAIELAKISGDEGEVPVGAVVTKNGEIVATGRNRREIGKNALYHAELEAIDNACKALGGWRLWQCELYVTLEPCNNQLTNKACCFRRKRQQGRLIRLCC